MIMKEHLSDNDGVTSTGLATLAVNNYKTGKQNILSNSFKTLNNTQHWTVTPKRRKHRRGTSQGPRNYGSIFGTKKQ